MKVYNGEIIDKFERFSNLYEWLLEMIINLMYIIDDMLVDVFEIEEVFIEFKEWVGDVIFVVYNVLFDMGFIDMGYECFGFGLLMNGVIDILELFCMINIEYGKYGLNFLVKKYGVELM